MPKITLTKEESEKYFYNSLCNGLSQMSGYGLEYDFKDTDYIQAKKSLLKNEKQSNGLCIEDVLMEILRNGKKITFNDIEGEGEYTKSITLEDVHNKVILTPMVHLINMIEENDDADTADVILQTVFFGKVIFG